MPALITWWTLDLGRLAPDASPSSVAALGADLLRRWNEPQRHYHTTSHLVEVFWALEELEEEAVLPTQGAVVARVAAWFHDAVYDPTARGGANEAASAQLAAVALRALGADADAVGTVERLVRMTDGHDDDGDGVSQAFHDADLWILSAPAARFDTYCGQVRAEYAHVPDEAYAEARSQLLGDLVRRDRLYLTGHAQQEWDEPARRNLGRELHRLGGWM